MNAYEIEQVEKQLKAEMQLPLSYVAWSEIERQARAERARAVSALFRRLFAAMSAKVAGLSRQLRGSAASARLNHG
jgi:hypothetical protein